MMGKKTEVRRLVHKIHSASGYKGQRRLIVKKLNEEKEKSAKEAAVRKFGRSFKIMYHFTKREHVRVFESFQPIKDTPQIICTPSFISAPSLNLTQIKYDISDHFKMALKDVRPSVVVQCHNSSTWHKKYKKYGIHTVYIGHGVWDGSPTNVKRSFHPFWSQFDMLIGGIPNFKKFLVENGGVHPDKIVLNALPQFDVLYDRVKNLHQHRESILKGHPASKIVVLFGHKNGREDFLANSVDFYHSAIRLAKLAEANGWLLVIKPKKETTFSFIKIKARKKEAWAVDCLDEFMALLKNPWVRFVGPFGDPYPYIASADAMVISGRSTIELEACLAQRPLVIVRTVDNTLAGNDTLKTIENECAYHVDSIDKLDTVMPVAVDSANTGQLQNQAKLVSDLGLTFDGKHYLRAVKAIRRLG